MHTITFRDILFCFGYLSKGKGAKGCARRGLGSLRQQRILTPVENASVPAWLSSSEALLRYRLLSSLSIVDGSCTCVIACLVLADHTTLWKRL